MDRPNYKFTGGIDRAVASIRADKSNFYDLIGVRQSQRSRGLLEQSPYFTNIASLSRGTYYNSGSQTEPASSPVCGVIQYRTAITTKAIYVTQYVIRDAAFAQLQVFYQTAPAAVNINTHCRLVINNITSLGVTLNNTIDVVIDGATTFKWRKNGGAYTTLVPITTAGVVIDSGNATVYFLTSTGFTVNDTWSWRRTDCANGQSSGDLDHIPTQAVQNGSELFFIGPENQVMVYQVSGCVVSAGYRPLFAVSLTIFEDHLILGGYSATYGTLYSYPGANTIAWSDLTDLHNFWATDPNEADQKLLPVVQDPATLGNQVLSVFVFAQQLYAYTNQGLFYTPYLGLPVVFSIKRFIDFPTSLRGGYVQPVVLGLDRVYIITEQGPSVFNGSSIQYVGAAICPLLVDANGLPTTLGLLYASYCSAQRELVWYVNDGYIYTYQELTNTFYRRPASFVAAVNCLAPSPITFGVWLVGTASLTLLREDVTYTIQPVKDGTSGTVYATRTIVLHAASEPSLELTKDIIATYISPLVTTVSSTYYSTAANLQVALGWYVSETGAPGTPTTDALAVWVNTNPDGRISYPRVAYKALTLTLTLNGLVTNKPPAKLTIVGIGLDIPALCER